ncbi:ATP-Hypothetical protein cassette sub-family A member [Nesidiocoris tenuis]|uniref:ABC transporter domain-containing protein n=1 Tax=Nesidiocoris tenuis TaxID=355587 RepID=A0ABN7ARW6_9HEMI|nr:ATP-Hypothetical protein cassette sub-family A member [Nesidiocoris tenuis]
MVYKSNEQELNEYMANATKKKEKKGFGINFSRLSLTELSYTLRSTQPKVWHTSELFPEQMYPGPMDNGKMYFTNGFLALQIFINNEYIGLVLASKFMNVDQLKQPDPKATFLSFQNKVQQQSLEFSTLIQDTILSYPDIVVDLDTLGPLVESTVTQLIQTPDMLYNQSALNNPADPEDLRAMKQDLFNTLKNNPEVLKGMDKIEKLEMIGKGERFREMSLQAFPYPPYRSINKDIMKPYWFSITVTPCTIVLTAAVFGVWMVQEKLSGMRELLKMNGIKAWMLYAGWFIMFGLVALPIAVIITACWKCPKTAAIPNSSPMIILAILIVYFLSVMGAVGFICSLVSSSAIGMILSIAHLILSLILEANVPKEAVILSFLALIPHIGLSQIIWAMLHLEAIDSGAYSNNLFDEPPTPEITLSIGVNLLIMIAGLFLNVMLMSYIDAIKPGPYGRARPWYFIVNCCRSSRSVHPAKDTLETTSSAMIEATPANKPVGLKINSLVKYFGFFKAVDNLNWTIYKKEITVLLGHNGAGKSTTFNMMCGMFSPTSGSILTDSYSLFAGNNLVQFRRELGYCPQHDLLFSDLSVHEHLIFFGMLKGFTRAEASEQSENWTMKFKIYHKRNQKVSKLSGGMKRKLCLSIALIGDPQYLLLDEPTSGLDPESRRDIWDVLLAARGNRTIVISTHDMEEADVLADRIAIMANGSLKCAGSTVFLKQKYGFGYRLKIAIRKRSDSALNLIQSIVPSARLLNKSRRVITVSLPAQDIEKFPALFGELDFRYKPDEYSLSTANMGDVFIKVQEEEGVASSVDAGAMPSLPKETYDFNAQKPSASLIWKRFKGLTAKRCTWACRKWISTCLFVLAIPLIFFMLLATGTNFAHDTLYAVSTKNLSIDLSMHKKSTVLIVNRKNDSLGSAFESLVTKSGGEYEEVPNKSIVPALLDLAKTNLSKYRSNTIVAYESKHGQNHTTGLYSTLAYHSAPILCGLLTNAYLQHLNLTARVSTYNYPYRDKFLKDGCLEAVGTIFIALLMASILIGFGLLIALSGSIIFPQIERITRFKHLELMTGTHQSLYWFVNWIVDIIFYLTGITICLLVLWLLDRHRLFTRYGTFFPMASSVYLYGCSSISFCYFVSFLFENRTMAMAFVIILSIAGSILLFLSRGRLPWTLYVFNLIPYVAFQECADGITNAAREVSQCRYCRPEQTDDCELDLDISINLIYMATETFAYMAIVILIDSGLLRFLGKAMKSKFDEEESDEIMDPNVAKERDAVEALWEQSSSTKSMPTFVCDGLGKKYSRKFIAVHDVSFIIPKNECFGLLGTNGAGKSTTFGMLTGTITPTKGDANIFSYSLSSQRKKYLERLGYCPQQDGLLPELSARSHLMLFGRLRGIPSRELPDLVQKWIDVLDMTPICDRPCQTYSGGNKRKLSTAIALIGDPPVVLLDEPTTGVDPVVSRKLWSVLKHCQVANGQTIILTSHSMDECEATCERITIMVEGRMQCIGTIPYLKNTFGRGFVLIVKLKAQCTDREAMNVDERIRRNFDPHITLTSRQHSLFSYSISSAVTLQRVFQIMISTKASQTKIEDFSVANISLEQVFMSFAEGKKDS